MLLFGQCYLGGHLRALHNLRHHGLIAEAVSLMMERPPALHAAPPDVVASVSWTLAGRVLERAAAHPDPDDPARIAIDPDFLREELQRVLAAVESAAR